jgi:hypothetical protein
VHERQRVPQSLPPMELLGKRSPRVADHGVIWPRISPVALAGLSGPLVRCGDPVLGDGPQRGHRTRFISTAVGP